MRYDAIIRGYNSARIIQEIKLNVVVRIDNDKLKNPALKLEEITKDLESVIEKYFDCCDVGSEFKPY